MVQPLLKTQYMMPRWKFILNTVLLSLFMLLGIVVFYIGDTLDIILTGAFLFTSLFAIIALSVGIRLMNYLSGNKVIIEIYEDRISLPRIGFHKPKTIEFHVIKSIEEKKVRSNRTTIKVLCIDNLTLYPTNFRNKSKYEEFRELILNRWRRNRRDLHYLYG